MTIPTMATVNEAAKMFGGTLTAFRIRQLALNNEIPNVRAGKKILINIEKLCDYLNNPNPKQENAPQGIIRKVAER